MKKTIAFAKYQGAGNDFIMINGFNHKLPTLSKQQINRICDRHFGIGADGLIILCEDKKNDFYMKYYNADGKLGTFCGNGARASVLFAFNQNLIKKYHTTFSAADGKHTASIHTIKKQQLISVSMQDVHHIQKINNTLFFLNTGSPHLVKQVSDVETINLIKLGKQLRYDDKFTKIGGTNVNIYSLKDNVIHIRTYERGVENETLACGTGITATAIVANHKSKKNQCNTKILANGIPLNVQFEKSNSNVIHNIKLTGPASLVFTGSIII